MSEQRAGTKGFWGRKKIKKEKPKANEDKTKIKNEENVKINT